mgnify:CR=1 FL=1
MIFLDSETCGLSGMPVIIQHAVDDNSVHIHNVWLQPVNETLNLIERLCKENIVGFNLAFDWFHINKLYNIFYLIENKQAPPNIDEVKEITKLKPNRLCLKPKGALDLMLHLHRTEWQTLMGRDDVRIRKVPTVLAHQLAGVLKQKMPLPSIYFAKRSSGYAWSVELCETNPDFSDVVLHWGSTYKLKPICGEIFKTSTIDFPLPDYLYPDEHVYNPYNLLWVDKLVYQIEYWRTNKQALSYAEQDIILLQRLYHYFGEPEFNDTNSQLAIAVACARWAGFTIDYNIVEKRLKDNLELIQTLPINFNSFSAVRNYLYQVANEGQKCFIQDTTHETLQALVKFGGELGLRATRISQCRSAAKENDVLYKLVEVGRFCPDFKVLGTKSGRMSGNSDLNPQGIPKDQEFRSMFILADPNESLSGGDFISFEVVLADAAYNDETLRGELQSGKKFHALFGQQLFNDSYEDILADADKYKKSKTSAFGLLYGAQAQKISQASGVDLETAELAYENFIKKYPKVGSARQKVFNMFCSMRQPGGLGTPVEWHEPAAYVESLLGFKRYFILENTICKTLFQLANNPPDNLTAYGKLIRTNREQTPRGALQSALYSAAFQIQAANMRAAANHVIQSTGAEICKELQCVIWSMQPSGIHPWHVKLLNVHDEIECTHVPALAPYIRDEVIQTVEKYRTLVPLIAINWKTGLNNWSEV